MRLPRVKFTVRRLMTVVAVGALAFSLKTARAADPYFPGVSFADRKRSNDFRTEWYSRTLEAMEEPPLWGLSRTTTIYRVLWLPSGHPPIVVRVIVSGNSSFLVVKRLKAFQERDEHGQLLMIGQQVTYTKCVPLSRKQWEGLSRRIKASHYWSMPTKDPRLGGEDGDELLVEAADGGRYHVVDRHNAGPAYLELCRYILDLGLDVRAVWREYHEE